MVVRSLPFQRTTEDGMKLLPVTVSVTPLLPAVADMGLMLLVLGVGLLALLMTSVPVASVAW